MLGRLHRRVKARRDEESDEDASADPRPPSADEDEEDSTDGEESPDEGAPYDEEEVEDQDQDLASISFGALAKAQDSLGAHKHESSSSTSTHSEKAALLRQKLREIRQEKHPETSDPSYHRSSKHAPTEQSSRKAVSRRRDVVAVPRRDVRDPRFEPLGSRLSGRPDDGGGGGVAARAKYAFLEAYRDDEMRQLREAIRTTRDEHAQAALQRQLRSMESQREARAAGEQRRAVVRRHRVQEKERVKQGKKPFYLKKAEQKKLALIERYAGLKEKQVERVMERKRKKKTQRERKNMPAERRGAAM